MKATEYNAHTDNSSCRLLRKWLFAACHTLTPDRLHRTNALKQAIVCMLWLIVGCTKSSTLHCTEPRDLQQPGLMSTEYVKSLFVTLRRSLAGKPWRHRRVLEALGLRVLHQCVEKPNNSMIRGMLSKVPHLVIIETDRMFYLRGVKQYYEQLPREPWVVHHSAAVAAHLAQQEAAQSHMTLPTTAAPSPATSKQGEASSTATNGRRTLADAIKLHPSQSGLLKPHLEEHMLPLPEGANTTFAPTPPSLKERITSLIKQRGELVQRKGLYHPAVREINEQIMQVRKEQVEEESKQRQAALLAKHTPGPHQAKVRASGRGSRRGMLAEARAKAQEKLDRQAAAAAASG